MRRGKASEECHKVQLVMRKCTFSEELNIETERETDRKTERQRDRETERQKETEAMPILTLAECQACSDREREREGGGVLWACVDVCVRGQTFPWQDPWDPAEGRVQPLKERLRAQQSISGLHLHNKWSSHGFSSAHTRAHTTYECIHSALISTRRRKVRAMGREGEKESRRERERGQLSVGVVLYKY